MFRLFAVPQHPLVQIYQYQKIIRTNIQQSVISRTFCSTQFDFLVPITRIKIRDEIVRTDFVSRFEKNIYGYSPCEDSTSVLTIKYKDYRRSCILHSCDFAIVYNCKEGQQYIRYNKQSKTYAWAFQTQPYRDLKRKADALKKKDLWDEVLGIYLDKKNRNTDPDKHSRSLYAETINECYQRHFGK